MSREKAYTITMLDSSQVRVVLPKKCNGQDCLDQVRTLVKGLQSEKFTYHFCCRFVAQLVCWRRNILAYNIMESVASSCG